MTAGATHGLMPRRSSRSDANLTCKHASMLLTVLGVGAREGNVEQHHSLLEGQIDLPWPGTSSERSAAPVRAGARTVSQSDEMTFPASDRLGAASGAATAAASATPVPSTARLSVETSAPSPATAERECAERREAFGLSVAEEQNAAEEGIRCSRIGHLVAGSTSPWQRGRATICFVWRAIVFVLPRTAQTKRNSGVIISSHVAHSSTQRDRQATGHRLGVSCS